MAVVSGTALCILRERHFMVQRELNRYICHYSTLQMFLECDKKPRGWEIHIPNNHWSSLLLRHWVFLMKGMKGRLLKDILTYSTEILWRRDDRVHILQWPGVSYHPTSGLRPAIRNFFLKFDATFWNESIGKLLLKQQTQTNCVYLKQVSSRTQRHQSR